MIRIDWNPGRRQLRQFAALFFVFGAAAATWFAVKAGSATGAIAAGSAAVAVGAAGAIRPSAVRPVYVALMVISYPIGFVVSTVLSLAIYGFVLTPIGLVARWVGHDPLGRRSQPDRGSYWVERNPRRDRGASFRQY